MAWLFPEGVEKETKTSELDDRDLEFLHDQMHVFWKKVEEGFTFNWAFTDIYIKHKESVSEMIKRKMKHIHPVNNLDKIHISFTRKEVEDLISGVSKGKKL